jgi:hypothetical protein
MYKLYIAYAAKKFRSNSLKWKKVQDTQKYILFFSLNLIGKKIIFSSL